MATVRKDGRPHTAPIWFIVEGETLVFTRWHESVKAANWEADKRVSLCIDDDVRPYRYVIVVDDSDSQAVFGGVGGGCIWEGECGLKPGAWIIP